VLRVCINCALLLTVGILQVSHAQEASGKPEVPTAKPVQSSIPLPKYSPPRKTGREAETVADLSALATSVSGYISGTGCQPKSCTVLVTDFTLADGNTSTYGMQLADTLSRNLTSKEYKLRVTDRRRLQAFVAKERVPAQSEHRAVIRWISDELDTRFIVFGTTDKIDNGLVNLSSQLIDTESKEWRVFSAIVNLGPLDSAKDLAPMEPLAPLPQITTSLSGEKLERAGVNGTTLPGCTYMPNPPYSESARRLKLNGPVTAEAVINSQGELENIRIVRGLPGGLNETTIATLRTWRCHPALKDGKPVPVLVPFTVTFRMYDPLSL
jgi:protein TonB